MNACWQNYAHVGACLQLTRKLCGFLEQLTNSGCSWEHSQIMGLNGWSVCNKTRKEISTLLKQLLFCKNNFLESTKIKSM